MVDIDIKASFVYYPDNFTVETRTVTYLDPCRNAYQSYYLYSNIERPYSYDGSVMSYTEKELIPKPSFCPVTYTCQFISGDLSAFPGINGCNVPGVTTFDEDTAVFTIQANVEEHYKKFKPGFYHLFITGIINQGRPYESSLSKFVTLEMKNLCSTTTMELIDTKMSNIVYTLSETKIRKPIKPKDLFKLEPDIECGGVEVVLKDIDGTRVTSFSVFRQTSLHGNFEFVVDQQNIPESIGYYGIYYNVTLLAFPKVNADFQEQFNRPAFTVEIKEHECTLREGEKIGFACANPNMNVLFTTY